MEPNILLNILGLKQSLFKPSITLTKRFGVKKVQIKKFITPKTLEQIRRKVPFYLKANPLSVDSRMIDNVTEGEGKPGNRLDDKMMTQIHSQDSIHAKIKGHFSPDMDII